MMLGLLSPQDASAQCSYGDQTAYGQGEWRGYVYSPIANTIPADASFSSSAYIGYVTRTEIFDQNLGAAALPQSATMCAATGINYFLIRYKMQKNLAAGYYTFTVGGDDGYRLSLDGGATFPAATNDWTDHGYHTNTATYYFAGGVANLVFEYFEHGGDSRVSFTYTQAACTSTAPTSITGTKTVSCSAGTTLTAAGGLAGTNCTYQWGIGTVIGQNIIAGQTAASITVHPLSTKTYWVRRISAAPCSATTDGTTTVVTMTDPVYGDPSVYGDNVWNVYGYVGADLDFGITTTEYAGYYTASTVGFDTQAFWSKAASPSGYSGYHGCVLPVDYFTFVHKRKGFPCGSYAISMENWDDDSRLYINGVQVWAYNGYSGGVPVQNIGTYSLDGNSTIELRVEENGGDANAKLVLTPISPSTAPASVSGVAFCCKDATVILTATGGVLGLGAQYEWGIGTVSGSNIIAGQNTATLTIAPSDTTTYWVRIKNGDCYTAAVTKLVTVPGAVIYSNGAWSGTPTLDTPVEIQSSLVMTQDLLSCSCQVKNNAALTVSNGKTLTVKRKLTVDNGSTVEVMDNGALVQIDKIDDEGTIILHKNSNPLYRLDYTMWSAPVAGQQLLSFSPKTSSTRFYEYRYGADAITGVYNNYYYSLDAANTTFAAGKGYLIRMPNGGSLNYNAGTESLVLEGKFTGVPNNGDITVPASVQGNRFTAVGNPYPSPISVSDFFAANSGVLDSNSAIYLWRKRNNSLVASYATLTLAGYTANTLGGGGTAQKDFYRGSNTTWLLAQGQGFIVKTVANPVNTTITFANSMRRAVPTTGTQAFFRSAQSTTSRVWLNLTGNETDFSQAAIAYIDGATTGLDYGYDGQQIADGTIAFYSVAADTKLAIQARPLFDAADVVPMGFTTANAGSYTVSIDHTDGVFEDGQDVYLKDKVLGITQDLKAGAYTFTTEGGTFTDRFEVVYKKADGNLGTTTPVLNANSIMVYKEGASININSGTTDITGVAVYDIRGRKLFGKDNINAAQTAITGLASQKEVLIIEISTPKGKVSKKIVY